MAAWQEYVEGKVIDGQPDLSLRNPDRAIDT
jgi:hypothetical protein